MSTEKRPLLAIRLIGPAATVKAHAAVITAQLNAQYGRRATCRTSIHPASHTGEIRAYITVTPREQPQ